MAQDSVFAKRYLEGSYIPGKEAGWHESASPWKSGWILQILQKNKLAPATVCEVGCGAGGILQLLQSEYPVADFTGYDISPQAIELAKPKSNDRLRFFAKDLLSEPQRVFDLVIAADVFEHVQDYLGFLQGLRPYGRDFVFHIPLDMSAFAVFEETRLLKRRSRIGHIHYFSKATAIATLVDTGYEIVDWAFTPTGFTTPWAKTHWLRYLPIRIIFRIAPELTVRLFGEYSLLVLARGRGRHE
jgi:hypothetical protein